MPRLLLWFLRKFGFGGTCQHCRCPLVCRVCGAPSACEYWWVKPALGRVLGTVQPLYIAAYMSRTHSLVDASQQRLWGFLAGVVYASVCIFR